VPYITIAPSGCVMLAPGTPENCTVLVAGLTAVCAPAKIVASKTTKQQEMRVTALRREIPCCPTVGISVEFKVVPSLSRKPVASRVFIMGSSTTR